MIRILKNACRPRVAALDARRLLAAHPTAALAHGVLTIKGTDAADVIAVAVLNRAGGMVTIAGTRQAFPAAQVKRIELFGGPGNDTLSIQTNGRPNLAVQIVGGAGRNTINGTPDTPAAVTPVVAVAPTTTPAPVVAVQPVAVLPAPAAAVIAAPTAAPTPVAPVVATASPVGNQAAPVVLAMPASPGEVADPAPTAADSTPAAVEGQIVDLVNAQRVQAGLAPLTVSTQLGQMADIQAGNMARLDIMSHDLPGTATPGLADRASAVGYTYAALGENIAFNYAGATAVMDGWMASPEHRANILNPNYTQIGVSVATDATGQPYYAEEFGRPA